MARLLNSSQKAELVKYGRSYKTDEKMWNFSFERKEIAEDNISIVIESLDTNKMIGIKNLKKKTGMNIDRAGLLKGTENIFHIAKGDEY